MRDQEIFKTTPTGIPYINCDYCERYHTADRDHCTGCRAASLFLEPETGLCLMCREYRSRKMFAYANGSDPRPPATDGLSEQERTGYAAQELADTDIHTLSARYMMNKRPWPVNADHTALYHLYS